MENSRQPKQIGRRLFSYENSAAPGGGPDKKLIGSSKSTKPLNRKYAAAPIFRN